MSLKNKKVFKWLEETSKTVVQLQKKISEQKLNLGPK